MNRWRIIPALLLPLVLLVTSLGLITSANDVPDARADTVAVAPAEQLPAHFIPDETGSRFYAKSSEVGLVFAPGGVNLRLGSTHVGLHPVDASPDVRLVGTQRAQATASYYLGNDRGTWREQVPMYTEVTYRELYPGVDLTYRVRDGALKSEFVIQPGARLDQIRMAYSDVSSLAVDSDGHLVIEVAGGATLRETIPWAYQQVGRRRVPVDVAFRLVGEHSYGFAVRGTWDCNIPLVIDPVLMYATFLGGSERDEGWAVAVDGQGNTFVTGITFSGDFPYAGVPSPTYGGAKDVFVAKFNAGGQLVYSTFFGGTSGEEGNSIGVDSAGNAYVAGETYSSDFPTLNAWQPYFAGQEDAYVLKLNPNGTLAYSTFIGGTSAEEIDDLVVDPAGNVYVAGEVYSDDFPLRNPWQTQVYGVGDEDGFISIFDTYGELVYSTYIGAQARDQIFRITLDGLGHVYAAGMTSSSSFPVVNPLQSQYGGGWDDCFVLKFDPWSNQMIYSTFLGGADRDECWGIAVDAEGSAYVAGRTSSANFPRVSPLQPTYGGGEYDSFVAKLTPDGSALTYSTFAGGAGSDRAWDLALDTAGSVYVIGDTDSQNFPRVNALQPQYGGSRDGFLLRLDAAGALRYSSFLGGGNEDAGWGLAVDNRRVVHVAGATSSADMPTESPIQPYRGQSDAFVARLALVPTVILPVSREVGPEGGALWMEYPEHLTLLAVPPGAVSTSTVFTLTHDNRPNGQGDLWGINHFFRLDAGVSSTPSFTLPLQLTLGFNEFVGVISDTIDLYYLSPTLTSTVWITGSFTVTERASNYLVASIGQMGTYGLMGETNLTEGYVFLPLVLRDSF